MTDGDLKAAASATAFAADAIERHMSSEMYRNAVTANEYYRQHNVTINRFVQKIYSCSGAEAEDFTASKLRLASNQPVADRPRTGTTTSTVTRAARAASWAASSQRCWLAATNTGMTARVKVANRGPVNPKKKPTRSGP